MELLFFSSMVTEEKGYDRLFNVWTVMAKSLIAVGSREKENCLVTNIYNYNRYVEKRRYIFKVEIPTYLYRCGIKFFICKLFVYSVLQKCFIFFLKKVV